MMFVTFVETADWRAQPHLRLFFPRAPPNHRLLSIFLNRDRIKGTRHSIRNDMSCLSLKLSPTSVLFPLVCSCLSEFELPGAGSLLGGFRSGNETGEMFVAALLDTASAYLHAFYISLKHTVTRHLTLPFQSLFECLSPL